MKIKWIALCVMLMLICLCMPEPFSAQAECLHWVLCQNPTVCAECGEQGISVPQDEMAHEWLFTNLGETHQLYCLYCDYEEEPEEHFAMCDETTVCAACGAKNLTLEQDAIIHHDEFIDFGTQHQYRCTLCGFEDEPENHWATCNDPTTCAGCFLVKPDIPESEIYHKEKYIITKEQHQVICDRCDYTEQPVAHAAVCTAPTVCFYCKAPVEAAPLASLLHFDEYVATNITDTTHENYCTRCGFSWGVIPHRVNCADPTSCFACGKTGLNTADYTYYHAGPFEGMTISTSGHTFDCGYCGQHADNEAHTFDKGICYTCNYEQGTEAPEQPVVPDDPGQTERIPGDADDNGKVDIMDAMLILQHDVGWNVTLNAANADVDESGTADIMDAMLILQYDVGWNVVLK